MTSNTQQHRFEHSSVETGSQLPNGKTFPVWHVISSNLEIEADRGGGDVATPERPIRPPAALPVLAAGGGALLLAIADGGPSGVGATALPGQVPTPVGPEATLVTTTDSLDVDPDAVTVQAGEPVAWRSTSVLIHTVTVIEDSAADPAHVRLAGDARAFGSRRLGPDGSFRHTFTAPGGCRYVCISHEAADMAGTVVVRERTLGQEEETTP